MASYSFGRETVPPIPDNAYVDALLGAWNHFQALQRIVYNSRAITTGGYLMTGAYKGDIKDLAYDASTYPKQELLFNCCNGGNIEHAVEVGVNAGHSLLIMLLANPHVRIDAFDLCEFRYVRPCVEYLNTHFNNRVTLVEGDSATTFCAPGFNPGHKYDLLHIDGSHELPCVYRDMKAAVKCAARGALIVVDDWHVTAPAIRPFIRDGDVQLLAVPWCDATNSLLRTLKGGD